MKTLPSVPLRSNIGKSGLLIKRKWLLFPKNKNGSKNSINWLWFVEWIIRLIEGRQKVGSTNPSSVCNCRACISVARGRGRAGRGYSPPIGLSTKMQNKKNTTFLALLRLFIALELNKKWFKASLETYIQGLGLICQKLKSQINWNFIKCQK